VSESATHKVIDLIRSGLEKKLNGCSDRNWTVLYQTDGVTFHFLCCSKDRTYQTSDYCLTRICDKVTWIEAESAIERESLQDALAKCDPKNAEFLLAQSSENSRLMQQARETGVYDFSILQESEQESEPN